MIRRLHDNQTYDPQRGSFIVKARWNPIKKCFESPVDETRDGRKLIYDNMIEFTVS